MSKTVIELAKQAGWEYADGDGGFEPLWRFAELVRADERAKLAEQPAPAAQPAQYPEGDVVGPCVCGSWPGGKCLKCPRIEQPAQGEKK